MDKYIHIGKIAIPFGINGELIVVHSLGKKTNFNGVAVVFIETAKDKYFPYFLEHAKGRTVTESLLKFEGVNSKEAAKLLANKPLWLKEEDFRKLAGKQSAIALIGYTIIENKKEIGVVKEVIEQPHQILLTVSINEKEAYIPLHEEFLQKIDHKKKEIHVILPEGLLDIYTDN